MKHLRVLLILFVISFICIQSNSNNAYGSGKLYWIETDRITSQSKIRRANLNGKAVEDVLTNLTAAHDITLDLHNRKFYWIEQKGVSIRRANFDGSNIENLVTGFYLAPGSGLLQTQCVNGKCQGIFTPVDGKPIHLPHEKLINPVCIALDLKENKIYWGNSRFDNFQRSNLDGTNTEDLWIKELVLPVNVEFKLIDTPINIEIDSVARQFYWTDIADRKIQRANLNGENLQSTIKNMPAVFALALDQRNQKIYWSTIEINKGKIQRASLDGTNIETLVTGLNFPYDIALDIRSEKIYWSDVDWATATGKISRSNIDGTNVRDIITGLHSPSSLAIDPQGTYDISPDVNKLAAIWANVKSQ